jgi:hypothetical protein
MHRQWQEEADTESEDDLDELELAHRRLMTDGQKFRFRLGLGLLD